MWTIIDVPTFPVVSKPPRTVHWQGRYGGTTKGARKKETPFVKWAYYTVNDWEDEYKSEETTEPEAGSDDAVDDEDFRIPCEDEILEGRKRSATERKHNGFGGFRRLALNSFT